VATDRSEEHADTSALSRPVTVRLQNVSLRDAMVAAGDAAHVRLVYRRELLDAVARPVTFQATNMPLGKVFEQLLDGTRLVAVPVRRDIVSIEVGAGVTHTASGGILGTVVDASTKRPIAGVSVVIDDSTRAIATHENGTFRFPTVTPGVHKVTARRLGYKVSTLPVTVTDGQTTAVTIALTPSATALTDVVTTATGDRRRFEVGNAVGTIQADSIVPTTMIRNMSDLLQARLPGVVVSNTDGAVGAPSKIRLRGVSSMVLNNDPIIILDGVRLNGQNTVANLQTNVGSQKTIGQLAGPLQTPPLAPSRLDDIDPSTIESIDVLRGPSASSLYGTDAANGVIVIKTKKGHAGSWRTTVGGESGESSIPGRMPDMWWGWGHATDGSSFITALCNLAVGGQVTVSGDGCQQDSVTQFNPSNDPAMRTFGTGTNRLVNASLSGGTESLLQFFSGRLTSNVGMAKMSDAERRLIARMWSSPAPSWMVHPNTEQDVDGSSRTNFVMSPKADVSLTTTGSYRTVLNGGSGILNVGYGGGASPSDTLRYLPSEAQRTKVTSTDKAGLLSGTTNYRPWGWLSFTGTGGGDYRIRVNQSDLRAQDCSLVLQLLSASTACPSGHVVVRGETFVATANGGAHLSFTPRSWLTLQTALGEQYSHTNAYSLQAGNSSSTDCPLAFGSTLLSPEPVCVNNSTQKYAVNETQDEAATAGVYLEETITLFGVYYTFGVRHDVASAFGSTVTKSPPNYPKFNFSYPISEKSFFPKQPIVTSLRLRLAYGQSGNQASQTAVLNTYALNSTSFAGLPSTTPFPVVLVSTLGNSGLRPERGTEWEGGFDVSFLDDERLHAEVTMSRKFTRDEIVQLTLAPSFGVDNRSQYYNLGNVEDRSLEVMLTARILDARFANWTLTFSGTRNTNKLVTAAPGLNAAGPLNTQFRAGYPIFGYWGAPVESYADANGDGILQANEVAFGTPTYMGAPYPKGEVTYGSDLALWNGAFRFHVGLDQVIGQTSQILVSNLNGGNLLPRAAVDRSAPLAQQAAYIQAILNNSTYLGTSSSVRVNEMSATYTVPISLARTLHAQSLSITLKGRNIASWSSYAGKDPNVDTSGLFGEATMDDGTGTPQPRIWAFSFNLGL